ncbi:MAG: hypothetical protein ACODAU_10705, partial [Myxococcota bacterium]
PDGEGAAPPEARDAPAAEPAEEHRAGTVVVKEGVGRESGVQYADQGVVEVGGRLLLDIREDIKDFAIQPVIGYFLLDRFEITVIPFLQVTSVEGETFWRLGALVEPSYHHPFLDWLYGFIGLGLGFAYEEGPGFDGVFRPVVGVDMRVGRSGIFKPLAFFEVGLKDGAVGGGLQAGFTVMF